MDEVKQQIGRVLTDYRDGLLDSLDDAVDAVIDAVGGEENVRLQLVKPLELDRK